MGLKLSKEDKPMKNYPKEEWFMKYATRYHILKQNLNGYISNQEAAQTLNISLRHFKRLKAKFKKLGVKALIHGNCGRKPNNAYPLSLKQSVLNLFKSSYSNFSVSHFTDMLKELHNISISRETVRKWLLEANLIKPNQRRYKRRKRRPRSAKEGDIVFFDGSPHCWFGNELYTLLLAIDDATGKPLYALFSKGETVKDYFHLAYKVFSIHGLPKMLYVDRHSVFITTRHEGVHVKQNANKPTAFQVAMAELDVGIIYAMSPQAKGRIERAFRTFQERLVKELALQGIRDPEKATRYVNEIFIPRYIRKFGKKGLEKSYREVPERLKEILSQRKMRKVKPDFTISVEGRILQLKPSKLSSKLSGRWVEVRELFDGGLVVYNSEGERIPFEDAKEFKEKKRLRIKKIKKGVTFCPCR